MTRRPRWKGNSRDGLFWNTNGRPEIRDNPLVRECPWEACRARPFEPCTKLVPGGRRVRLTGFHDGRCRTAGNDRRLMPEHASPLRQRIAAALAGDVDPFDRAWRDQLTNHVLAALQPELDQLAAAADALKAVGKAALAVKPTLDQPYPERPDTTPWARFMDRPVRRAYNLGTEISRHRAANGTVTDV